MRFSFWFTVFITSILIASGLWAAEYESDLMIYYPYEEIVGADTIKDATGKGGADGTGYHGTINGDITLVEGGKFGKAAKFETGSFIDVHGEEIPEGETPTDAFTLCAWVKCENTGQHHAIFNARASDQTWLIHPELRSSGQFRWLLRTNGGTSIFDIKAGAVEWDTWLHYAGTYDKSAGGGLYINGQLVQEVNDGPPIAEDWGSGARVGYNIDNARPFTGLMDEFSIWKRALTKEEITNYMENGIEPQAVSPQDSLSITWGKLKGAGEKNRPKGK